MERSPPKRSISAPIRKLPPAIPPKKKYRMISQCHAGGVVKKVLEGIVAFPYDILGGLCVVSTGRSGGG